MVRKLCLLAAAVALVAGLAVAGEMEANGTVKSVSTNSFVVTDDHGKDMTFEVTKDTMVLAKGASHKMDQLKADGKAPTIGEFLAAHQLVNVKYAEKDGKMNAKEVRVKQR
jgi:hypothetical protein